MALQVPDVPVMVEVARPLAADASAPLRLVDVIASVDRHYPKVRGAAMAVRAADAKASSKEGAFDPVVSLGAESLRYNSASSRGKALVGSSNDFGVEWTTPEGTKVAAVRTLNAGGVKSPDSATGALGTWSFAVKVPLLRGNGVNDKLVARDQTRYGVPAARLDAVRLRFDVRFDASVAYWNWVGAVRRSTVRERLLDIATTRAAQIRTEVEAGGRPPIDSVEADGEVALREADLLKARRDVEKGALSLGKFLWSADGAPARLPDPIRAPGPESAPATPVPVAAEALENATRGAWERRPELAALALERRRLALDRRLAENDILPSVDLVVAPGLDLGDRGVGETMKAGVRISAPVGRIDARGRREEAIAKDRKLELDEELARRLVRIEVEDAVSAVNRAIERLGATDRSRRRLRELEDGERLRFQEGDSTLFLLNQRERQSAEAESRWIDAAIDVELARAQFRWSALLEDDHGIG
ncbi:MAG: TolC family protein [Armatimonadota bacterium]